MSIPKITGQQARELLDGTIDGPWSVEVHKRHDIIASPVGYAVASNEDSPEDGRANSELLAAAPALAEAVAWLYGREPDGPGPHFHRGRMGEYDQEAVASHPEADVVEVYAAHDHGQASAFLTPDEAVDLARALLAAAEEARP